ncbi:mucoidy inhibitor MuiA family protein [Croceitalea marina]|uniref:Mucoidy inhibitor MuiA family protein n=1 Tax=Croceitalea marina TaxID=1775166 RepID=A0ABW5MT28_9FLAO
MKKLVQILFLLPYFVFANEVKIPSKIKEVTVYLSGAQITRNANCKLESGTSEVIFTGLSHKIEESSIQVSGLAVVSILAMSYDINYLDKSESHPKTTLLENEIERITSEVTFLRNQIVGLEEEEKVITTNRLVSADNQALDLQKIKEISQYYRERITAIKNEVFKINLEINQHNKDLRDIQNQLAEANKSPALPQGELRIKFDAPIATTLNIQLAYQVQDAGWIPNYDIKSKALNAPLNLAYKANVYQNTGKDWNNVNVTLSTGNPSYNVSKPNLDTKYLNFVSAYSRRQKLTSKKKGYAFNPTVKRITGTVTDESGQPLPGVNVLVKGTTNGTQTDFDGNYTLNVTTGQELQFSYIGQRTTELPIYSSIMNIRMEEDAEALEEVVVTAYGSSSKNYSASVSSIEAEQLIQGRAAGVNINGASGSTHKAPKIRYQQPEPLVIVDGVPIEGFSESDIDQSEIQHIETLKDANATAIYGSRASNGVIVITTKKSRLQDDLTNAKFIIKKPYSIASDGDITAIEINTFQMPASYEYFAAPIINENVFLTASFKDWEKYQLLPGEANIYFEGTYAGKTALDPYTVKKEMVLSLGIDANITVTRKQQRNFKSKSFTGSNRILDRTYDLEVKNNKNTAISLKLMDRIPKSQHKDIKVDDVETYNATYDKKNGLLSWNLDLAPKENKKESFSFQVKYPRGKYISL